MQMLSGLDLAAETAEHLIDFITTAEAHNRDAVFASQSDTSTSAPISASSSPVSSPLSLDLALLSAADLAAVVKHPTEPAPSATSSESPGPRAQPPSLMILRRLLFKPLLHPPSPLCTLPSRHLSSSPQGLRPLLLALNLLVHWLNPPSLILRCLPFKLLLRPPSLLYTLPSRHWTVPWILSTRFQLLRHLQWHLKISQVHPKSWAIQCPITT